MSSEQTQDPASVSSDAPPADDGTMTVAEAMRLSGSKKSTIHNCVPIHKGRVIKTELLAWMAARKELSLEKARKRHGLDEDWHRVYLDLGNAGAPRPTAANARIVLKNDTEWRAVFTHNAFSQQTLVYGQMPQPTCGHDFQQSGAPAPISDEDVWMTKVWLEDSKYRISLPKDQVRALIEAEARQTAYHPVVEYLESAWQQWDRTPRLDTWLNTYLGVEQSEYSKYVGRWWMISAVARVMEPGCQVDHVLVLEGGQGIGKSTALRTLATRSEWFLDSDLDLHSKETAMLLRGKWIVEFAELGGMRKSDSERIKGFFTTHEDKFIPKFQNYENTFKRQCVFAATMNPHGTYLNDEENRRFWTVKCNGMEKFGGQVDIAGIRRDLDQLWGEAKNEYAAFIACPECKSLGSRCVNHRWWPLPAEQKAWFTPEQDARKNVDPWLDAVATWMAVHIEDMGEYPTTSDVLRGIGRPVLEQKPQDEDRMRKVIRSIGRYSLTSLYVPPVVDADDVEIKPASTRTAWRMTQAAEIARRAAREAAKAKKG